MIGSQSVADQAPRGGPPDIWPILNEDTGNSLLTRTLLTAPFIRRMVPTIICDIPSRKHICLRHSQGLLRRQRHTVLLLGKVPLLYPSHEQM
jgi:hypothetical protein